MYSFNLTFSTWNLHQNKHFLNEPDIIKCAEHSNRVRQDQNGLYFDTATKIQIADQCTARRRFVSTKLAGVIDLLVPASLSLDTRVTLDRGVP